MIIRKYIGKTLQEIEEKCRKELGAEALILNVRQIKPKGLKKLWNCSPQLEAIAAIEYCSSLEEKSSPLPETITLDPLPSTLYFESVERIKARLIENAASLMKK